MQYREKRIEIEKIFLGGVENHKSIKLKCPSVFQRTGILISVEPEGFEPSSKHGIRYAFYMLSCYLIVGTMEG
jgi:hypothetical protein